MSYSAHLEPLVWECYVYPDAHAEQDYACRDPYAVAVTVTRVDSTTCEVKGVDKPMGKDAIKAIHRALTEAGFGYVQEEKQGKYLRKPLIGEA